MIDMFILQPALVCIRIAGENKGMKGTTKAQTVFFALKTQI